MMFKKGGSAVAYLLFILFFFLLLIPLVLGMVIPQYKAHKKATGGIVNYDPVMRKFVYRIPMLRQELLTALTTPQDLDELTCTLDRPGILRFSEYGSHQDYYFQIHDYPGFCILTLEQVALLGMQSGVPYQLNPFLIGKLQAEPLPFSHYGF